mmetsp:Transcript_20917/g.19974  ORF Transcript_20917/g.19974 Transcript_20917/m.19974 type:complete len:445 (+) Transcript_20917:1627-2961(+)
MGFGKLKGMLKHKEQKCLDDFKTHSNLIFNELTGFVQHFVNFSLPYEDSNDILIQFCDFYQLEQSRMHLLLTELQSNQKNTSSMFTEKELLIKSLDKRSQRLKNFGLTDLTLVAGMAIKYIDNDHTLFGLMAASKDFHEMLGDDILKQALLRSSQHKLKQKRRLLWLKILKIDPTFICGEFESYHQMSYLELPKHVEDSIDVDVNRSFNNLKEIQPQNLNRILKTYAIVNPHLDYCQGMNFIAGFLYLIMEDEALAFAVLREVIQKQKMSNLFNTELPMLKLNFYQLDRLVAILLPDLHAHFKDETINSSYFSSSYFITIFTSVLQTQSTSHNAVRLVRLWDYFIVGGWKNVFKLSIVIMKEYEESLLQMSFEIMLSQIISLPNKYLIKEYGSPEEEQEDMATFDRALSDVKISTMLLDRFKKEFDQNFKISSRSGAEGIGKTF